MAFPKLDLSFLPLQRWGVRRQLVMLAEDKAKFGSKVINCFGGARTHREGCVCGVRK